MQGEVFNRRIRVGLGLLVALTCAIVYLTVGLGSAAAQGGGIQTAASPSNVPDPQFTNIPYLAWRGEQLFIVKCARDVSIGEGQFFLYNRTDANWLITDWTGDPHFQPKFEQNIAYNGSFPFRGRGEQEGKTCWGIDVVSDFAGVAKIKLVVNSYQCPPEALDVIIGDCTREEENNFDPGYGDQRPVLKHDFLAIWMTLNPPALTELNLGGDEGPGPEGTGNFTPPFEEGFSRPSNTDRLGSFGELQALVTGTFPLRGFTSGVTGVPVGNAQLPQDWAALANRLAYDPRLDCPWSGEEICGDPPFRGGTGNSGPGGAEAAQAWDIMDEFSPAVNGAAREGHSLAADAETDEGASCRPTSGGTSFDSVDTCPDDRAGGQFPGRDQSPWGSFSQLYGNTLDATIGPFDPKRPGHTMMPDGVLDLGDAPMPPARIDFRIGAGPTTVVVDPDGAGPLPGRTVPAFGTFGTFAETLKYHVYQRGPASGHRFYQPFYASYIPATEASSGDPVETSSGTDGPRHGNNFSGYLDGGRGLCAETGAGATWFTRRPIRDEPCETGEEEFLSEPYVFWRFAGRWQEMGEDDCRDVLGNDIPTPAAPDHVAVYSDNHGEARVAFDPLGGQDAGNEAAIRFGGTAFENIQGACDPGELPGATLLPIEPGGPARTVPDTARQIGEVAITAEGKYPYEWIIDGAPVSAGPEIKRLFSFAGKSLVCRQVGLTTLPEAKEFICIETIHDMNGNPVEGALVCFTARRADFVRAFVSDRAHPEYPDALGNPLDTRENGGFNPEDDPTTACQRTGANGQAAVKILITSRDLAVDVVAENRGTRDEGGANLGVIREACIDTAVPSGTPAIISVRCPIGVPGRQNGGVVPTLNGSTTPSVPAVTAATITASKPLVARPELLNGSSPTAKGGKTTKAKAKLVSARLVSSKQGRYLVVRVNAPTRTVKIRISLIQKGHRTVKAVVRTVRANRAVRVPNLRIPKSVRAVNVRVLAS